MSHPHSPWYNEPSYVRGRKYLYYQKFRNEAEIWNDFVAHERPDKESIQATVDFLMARWRNPLSEQEAYQVAASFVERTKSDGQHWSTWTPSHLITHSKKQFKSRPSPPPPDPTRTTSWTPQTSSRLLQLPTEIRELILQFALTPDYNPPLRPPNRIPGIIAGSHASKQPPLSRTCHQLRLESLPLFYATNTFIFSITSLLALRKAQSWIARLTDFRTNNLHSIILLGFTRDLTPHQHFLNNLPPHLRPAILHAILRSIDLVPVRIGINLRDLSFAVETLLEDKNQWVEKFGNVMGELMKTTEGFAVSEWKLRQLLTVFGKEVEDVEKCGKRVDWWA